ncbi:MAG: tetratricopeptide repeat protein [Magnetococcales bacterium]|nr:tetratricopeptide repeat protein [Magnetococcales bacterium]
MGKKKLSSSLQKDQPTLNVDTAYLKAVDHFNAGQYSQADKLGTLILQTAPNHIDAINLLGVIAQKVDRYDLAIEQFERAIVIDGGIALLYFNLGISHCALNNNSKGILNLKKAIAINPNYAEAYSSLGNALTAEEELNKAVGYLQKAVAINNSFVEAHSNLGNALKAQGKLSEAKKCYQKAIDIAPNYCEAYNNLGTVYEEQGNFAKAIVNYKKAISLRPNYATAYSNLGNTLKEQGKFDEAIASFQTAISIFPGYAQAYFNLANTQKEQNKLQEAVFNYKSAISLKPDFSEAHSNLIFCIDLLSDLTSDLFQTERENWAKLHAEPLKVFWSPFKNRAEKERKLRIGYVGADFNQHSAAYIFGPMLLDYNHNNFEVYCYAGNSIEDNLTSKFKNKSTKWISTLKLDDSQLAQRIKNDSIDILVDLASHTKGGRLLTFARKPAPIQITAWGYPLGTSMEAMDYLFADAIAFPLSEHKKYREQLVDLSCIIHLYSEDNYPEIKLSPCLKNGYITFGAFNRIVKNRHEIYSAWAEILHNIPTAKLLIKTTTLDDIKLRKDLQNSFTKLGIAPSRLILMGKTSKLEHLEAHNLVDIMLDPFPHNGGVTTLESLKMGVPVLTCEKMSRCPISASALHVVGLDKWRATNDSDYVAKAVELAKDIQTLKLLREGLRDRFDTSVLGNSKLYVAEVEAIYRKLWKKWCTKQQDMQGS